MTDALPSMRQPQTLEEKKDMALNVAQKLIQSHLLEGEMRAGTEIALKVDQVLLQDVLGILVCSSSKQWASNG